MNKKASFITDYATLIVAIGVALAGVRLFMTRAVAGRMHDFVVSSGFDEQYETPLDDEVIGHDDIQRNISNSRKVVKIEQGRMIIREASVSNMVAVKNDVKDVKTVVGQ